jgi:hypothetical protein
VIELYWQRLSTLQAKPGCLTIVQAPTKSNQQHNEDVCTRLCSLEPKDNNNATRKGLAALRTGDRIS